MQKASLLCPFCLNRANLVSGKQVYPHRPDLYALKFWLCEPCDAYIGCHKEGARFKVGNTHYTSDGTAALGTLADAKTRKVRKLIEACISTVIGFIVTVLISPIVYPFFGHSFTVAQNIGITAVFTVASVLRGYIIRRWFNARIKKLAQQLENI